MCLHSCLNRSSIQICNSFGPCKEGCWAKWGLGSSPGMIHMELLQISASCSLFHHFRRLACDPKPGRNVHAGPCGTKVAQKFPDISGHPSLV
mmetsp:Transcript_42294/g.78742  ORF Transcript_42294/g.78742 Transcript_42294/m.78742 type:complete len:92 (+) Transcript_42294:927-1202(+)